MQAIALPLLFNRTDLIHQFLPSGPPLGVFENSQYTSESHSITKDEQLIMLTDGLYEWRYDDKTWGWANLLKFIEQHLSSPEYLWDSLQKQINKYSSSEGLTDDQTILFWAQKPINKS